ncbi:hypothetical protein NMG60_11025297 [Bertholletia excelsa]
MKPLFSHQPSPDLSNEASISGESRYADDKEMGTNAGSRTAEIQKQNAAFWCFPYGSGLDPLRQVLAEAVGTFILMFCICAIVAITQFAGGEVGLLEYAATAALTVVVVIFSIGAISGAHVNPAVTIAFATFGEFPWSKVPFYVLTQIMGAALATYVGRQVYGVKAELMTTRPLKGSTSAFWVELIASFILMFLASSISHQAKYVGNLAGIVVGVAIGLAVLITGPVSGGSMNPARSLGPAMVAWKFDDIWIYLIAPTVGALGGALLFHALRLQRHTCCSNFSSNTTVLPDRRERT